MLLSLLSISTNASRFSVTNFEGDYTVTDNVTGLIWQQALGITGSAGSTGASQPNYCASLNLAGFSSNWRNPTIKELYTLVELSNYTNNYMNSNFTGINTDVLWTSTYSPDGCSAQSGGFCYYSLANTLLVQKNSTVDYNNQPLSSFNVHCVHDPVAPG
ncbi:MAG: DUF1566 domain-containing protein [Myxococcaceae bacterium]